MRQCCRLSKPPQPAKSMILYAKSRSVVNMMTKLAAVGSHALQFHVHSEISHGVELREN